MRQVETRAVRHVSLAGTEWPIPDSWSEASEHVFRGPQGLLELTFEDGQLIDPARCRAAESSRPAGWQLARTRNGTAITATYEDRDALVIVFAVRLDPEDMPQSTEYGLPELQATYVLARDKDTTEAAIRESLECRAIPAAEHGSLDEYGHAAMGPVPFLGSWMPVGDHVDNTGTLGTQLLGGAYLMLVGGGWLVFSDAKQCCGAFLEPLAWRRLDEARALEKLRSELSPKGLTPSLDPKHHARVWDCSISSHGLSYVVHADKGRVHGCGAFWTDAFGQAWRLHYWLDPADGPGAERLLRSCCGPERHN